MPSLTGYYYWRKNPKDPWQIVYFVAFDNSIQKIGDKGIYFLKSFGGEFGGRIITRAN